MTRRAVQFVLGLLWLIDGVLQMQPFMFTSGLARSIVQPAANGQPAIVATAVTRTANILAAHPALWNLLAVAVQLALGVGIVMGLRKGAQWTRIALGASIVWALGVWYLGEGLGGMASGHADIITGAPGAAVLYAILALAVWPRWLPAADGRRPRLSNALPVWLPTVWAAIWLLGAELLLLSPQRGATGLAAQLSRVAPRGVVRLVSTAGTPGLLLLALVFAAVGISALGPPRIRRWSAAAGVLLGLVFWSIGQGLGQVGTGQATDLGSGPLLVLLAGALTGVRARRPAKNTAEAPTASATRDVAATALSPARPATGFAASTQVLTRSRAVLASVLLLVAGCSVASGNVGSVQVPLPNLAGSMNMGSSTSPSPAVSASGSGSGSGLVLGVGALPGMPPVLVAGDVYAADRPNELSPVVSSFPPRVYVPNSLSNTVTVIDPTTFKVLETVAVGREPQHVVPSWDLRTLWVNNDLGNSLTPIDPATGVFGRPVYVHDPYNLYFTPDGKYAVVMASADRQLVFRDPHTMAIRKVVPVPCAGVNHADFSANGRYFLVSCEFSAQILKVDTEKMAVVGVMRLPGGGMPQDVKLAPDGHVFYVADMMRNGIWLINGDTFKITRFIHTGAGAHGEYMSRDSKTMYISNRGEGSISLLNVATDTLIGKWWIPGGGSPDMGGVSADGKVLWLTGRYNSVVYAISTVTGKTLAKIPVGAGPHGLCIYPQPGRYSLGHTGVFR